MHVLNPFQHLVHDILFVDIFHDSCTDNGMEISLHKVKYEVNVFGTLGFDYVEETDNIRVTVELLQKNDLG